MRNVLQYVFWTVGFGLEALVISALVRGSYKKYPLILAYCVSLLLTTVIEVSASTAYLSGARKLARSWRVYYWVDDAVLQALTFCVVISLVLRAMESVRARQSARRWLIAGAILVFALSFAVHAGPLQKLSSWMTLISRDLSISAVILNLVLWLILIVSRKKDQEVLLLSGGLGIQFTGAVIGHTLRQLAVSGRYALLEMTGNIVLVVTYFICMYVWWQTFRARKSNAVVANRN